MNNLSLKTKLLLGFMFAGSIALGLTGWVSYMVSKKSLTKASFDSLKAIREMKKRQIESYFEQLRNKAIAFAEDDMVIEALLKFKDAFYKVKSELNLSQAQFDQYKRDLYNYYTQNLLKTVNLNLDIPLTVEQIMPSNDNAIILQYLYTAKNPNPIKAKDNLNNAHDGSLYSSIHEHYQPIFRDYLKRLGIYDFELFDLENGMCIFNVTKELDFANSFFDTKHLQQTSLSKALRYTRTVTAKDFVKLVDYEFYNPSYGMPAAFITVPVFNKDKKIGALVFQLSIDDIDTIMTDDKKWEDVGLGLTGESILIGKDYKMRSIARELVENPAGYLRLLQSLGVDRIELDKIKLYGTSILLQEIVTVPSKAIVRGETGESDVIDYKGDEALAAYAPLNIKDVEWGIISKINTSEALAPIYKLTRVLLLAALITLFLLIVYSLFFIRAILAPLYKLNDLVRASLGLEKLTAIPSFSVPMADYDVASTLAKSLDTLVQKMVAPLKELQVVKKELEQSVDNVSTYIDYVSTKTSGEPACVEFVKTSLDQAAEEAYVQRQRLVGLLDHMSALISDSSRFAQYIHLDYKQLAPTIEHFMSTAKENSTTSIQLNDNLKSIALYLDKLTITIQNTEKDLAALSSWQQMYETSHNAIVVYKNQLVAALDALKKQVLHYEKNIEKAKQDLKDITKEIARFKELGRGFINE
jgi:methyl-accepting chemotaxis protein